MAVGDVRVHPRVSVRHPEIEERDVLDAWERCLRSAPRDAGVFVEYLAIGVDCRGRLIEMIAVRTKDGEWFVYHAMTPPSKKTFVELRLKDRR